MAETEEVVQEYTNDTSEFRRIRVYDNDKGDFFLDLPPNCRMTFGYFNPAAAGEKYDRFGGRGHQTMKATALRIYGPGGDKNQLAAFIGVDGFRDEAIKLTKIVQKVTIESRLVDDGEGTVEYGGKQMRELTASPESEF